MVRGGHVACTCACLQVGCGEESVVGAHARACWAAPEPEGAGALVLRAPGGTRATLALDAPEPHAPPTRLAYQNFIYCAFSNTEPRYARTDPEGRAGMI